MRIIMMRVLTPNGTLIEVEKAEPIVEERIHFNGSDLRLCQIAKDGGQPVSGIFFTLKNATGIAFDFMSDRFLVGNLSTEAVKKFMGSLVKDGYCDFSQIDFQKEISADNKPVFDNGKTLPYYCGGSIAHTYSPKPANMDFKINGVASMDAGVLSMQDDVLDILSDEKFDDDFDDTEDI